MPLIDLTIAAREKDLGGFSVRRLLPYAQRRMVGPFIFLDHMGPAQFEAGHGIDVRPHPHIGISTVTYLFEGEIHHRDTLGYDQTITPGAVNWMTAGRGIAHSERTTADDKGRPHPLHGIQSWVALPKSHEQVAPGFRHHASDSLPEFTLPGAQLKLIAGQAYGYEAPTAILSEQFYLEVKLEAGASFALPTDYTERALYLVSGSLRIGNATVAPLTMPVFAPGEAITVTALEAAHFMLLGGEPFTEKRYIWWNFVASSEEAIEQAKLDWTAGKFGTIPNDDKEFIPLPAS